LRRRNNRKRGRSCFHPIEKKKQQKERRKGWAGIVFFGSLVDFEKEEEKSRLERASDTTRRSKN
jgi:hypothetical protein